MKLEICVCDACGKKVEVDASKKKEKGGYVVDYWDLYALRELSLDSENFFDWSGDVCKECWNVFRKRVDDSDVAAGQAFTDLLKHKKEQKQ